MEWGAIRKMKPAKVNHVNNIRPETLVSFLAIFFLWKKKVKSECFR
jgi:hypothetical protein